MRSLIGHPMRLLGGHPHLECTPNTGGLATPGLDLPQRDPAGGQCKQAGCDQARPGLARTTLLRHSPGPWRPLARAGATQLSRLRPTGPAQCRPATHHAARLRGPAARLCHDTMTRLPGARVEAWEGGSTSPRRAVGARGCLGLRGVHPSPSQPPTPRHRTPPPAPCPCPRVLITLRSSLPYLTTPSGPATPGYRRVQRALKQQQQIVRGPAMPAMPAIHDFQPRDAPAP